MIVSKTLRDFMINSLTAKLGKMKANGSNCADVLAKLEKWKRK